MDGKFDADAEFEKIIDQAHEKGLSTGIWMGIWQGVRYVLYRQFEHQLARPLTSGERDLLGTRIETLGHERVSDLVVKLDAAALAAWLADPGAA